MSILQNIEQALEDNKLIQIVKRESVTSPCIDRSPRTCSVHNITFYVAPRDPLYEPSDLARVLENLVPTPKPFSKRTPSILRTPTGGEFLFGDLKYREEVGIANSVYRVSVTLHDGAGDELRSAFQGNDIQDTSDNPIKLYRFIDVRLFPDSNIADQAAPPNNKYFLSMPKTELPKG